VRKTLSLMVAVAGMAFGAPVITVIPSIGPSSAPGVGSAANYNLNALTALSAGLTTSSIGSPPSHYTQVSGPVPANSVIETTFNSWLGLANPAAPFNNEFGNNLYFGLRIIGGSESFALNNLVYTDNLGLGGVPFSFNGDTYDSRFLAYIDNGNGTFDPGDTQVVQGTSGATSVNYLFYRGVGAFFSPFPEDALLDPQTQLNNAINGINGGLPVALTGGYCLAETAGSTDCRQGFTSATANLSSTAVGGEIPEPSTYALMGLGLAALAYARRRLA